MSTLRRATIPILASVLLVLALAAPVFAHAELTSSDPEDKAVLATPPTVITLKFSEGLSQAKSSFVLNGPTGTVGKGIPTRQGGKVMTLDGLTLDPGAYSIAWTAAATDGHIERGTLSFSVSEPTPAPATPSPTPAASEAAPGSPSAAPAAASTVAPATEAPAATAAPSPADGGDAAPAAGTGTDVLLPIVIGLVLVVGLGAFLVSRSRRA